VTYNHENTGDFFKQRTRKLEEMGHDPTDLHAAIEEVASGARRFPSGSSTRRTACPRWTSWSGAGEGDALARRPLEVSPENARALVQELL